MKKISNSICYLFLLLFLTISLISCSSSQQSSQDAISKILAQEIAKYNIPGLVMSISYPGKPIETFALGYSDVQKKIPMQKQTLFQIGSVTKSFIAALTLQLQEQGKLKISDTLQQVARPNTELATVLEKYPSLQSMTLYQLLTHTSGVPDILNASFFGKEFAKNPMKQWSDTELLNMSMAQRLGSRNKYHYSNTDYLLVGLAIESITGQSLQKSMQALFDKADLSNIYYLTSGAAIPNIITKQLAHGYMLDENEWPNINVFRRYPAVTVAGNIPEQAYDVTELSLVTSPQIPASGGIITNTETMVKWFQALMSESIINNKSLQEMLRGVPTQTGTSYGLGVITQTLKNDNLKIIFHNGSQLGYQTNVFYVPSKKITIAIAINSSSDVVRQGDSEIMADLWPAILEK